MGSFVVFIVCLLTAVPAAADFLLTAAAYGSDRGIYLFDSQPNRWNTVLGATTGFTNDPIEITYDNATGRVMWNDHSIQAVRSNFLNGSGIATVFSYASGGTQLVIDGMFMESRSRYLYYTETNQGIVARRNINTGVDIVLKLDVLSSPRDIVVDPDAKKMYWTDWGAVKSVWSANDDGTGAQRLVSTWSWLTPNGLFYDKQNMIIYVCDVLLTFPTRTDIVAIYLASNTAQRLASFSGSHCFDLAGNNTHLFMSDWGMNNVVAMPKASVPSTTVLATITSGRYFGLHYHSQSQVSTTPSRSSASGPGAVLIPRTPLKSRAASFLFSTVSLVLTMFFHFLA